MNLQKCESVVRAAVDDALKDGVPFANIIGLMEIVKSDVSDALKVARLHAAQRDAKILVPNGPPSFPRRD